MKADCVITLWHFCDAAEGAARRVFKNVCVNFVSELTKSGIKEMGLHSKDSAVVRIPTDKCIDVACGDYIRIGECEDDMPDRGNALKVVSVSDNRRGASPHWRLSCGG